MSRTIVVEADLEISLKKFKRILNETKRDFRKHEYYLRPGLRRMEKEKEALKKRKKY
ncbi:MAG: 30S ribosomal protein S21 [Mycoplasma sp.]